MWLNDEQTTIPANDPFFQSFFHFDIGNVLTILTFLITIYRLHEANKARITHIEFRVGLMWKHFATKFNLPDRNIWDADDREVP